MRNRIWRDFMAAAVEAVRGRTSEQEEALRAERARGVDRLGQQVVRQKRARRRTASRRALRWLSRRNAA
ncbi:hypothetical protein ACTWLT_16945 [Micromonospora sp. ZYX-F-536]|uniref:hypothetical protein n=1 Tax=Micromonospora sp. ZYX-F-536 TaxID=3457629 RepID=UPI004040A068